MLHPFSCVFEQAEKNVYLEERVQVLQQQNEDLKERIDKNLAVSRSVFLTFIYWGNYHLQTSSPFRDHPHHIHTAPECTLHI